MVWFGMALYKKKLSNAFHIPLLTLIKKWYVCKTNSKYFLIWCLSYNKPICVNLERNEVPESAAD